MSEVDPFRFIEMAIVLMVAMLFSASHVPEIQLQWYNITLASALGMFGCIIVFILRVRSLVVGLANVGGDNAND